MSTTETSTISLILDDLDVISTVIKAGGLNKGQLAELGVKLVDLTELARQAYKDGGKSAELAPTAISYLHAVCPECSRTWQTHDLGKGTISQVCGLCAKGPAPAPTAVATTAPVAAPVVTAVKTWAGDILDGTYTVTLPNGDYRTLKIQTQDLDASFMPGKRIASYLNGPDNWSNYKGFAFVNSGNTFHVWRSFSQASDLVLALSILMSGPEAMVNGLKVYGKASQKCGLCGRKLTTPESLARGIGPECAGKLGL